MAIGAMTRNQPPPHSEDDDGPEDAEMDDAVRDAEAIVAALAADFLGWIRDDIDGARAALEAAKTRPGANQDDIGAIFDVMHNLKGQGGSFGYDLLTVIGGSLCDYIRHATSGADERQLKVIAAHFAAIDFVIAKDIRGPGGEVGDQLRAKLDELIANVPAPE